MRGATGLLWRYVSAMRYFNPRAPCGARQVGLLRRDFAQLISIHAPRAGRDDLPILPLQDRAKISIHAPRAGRDRRLLRLMLRVAIDFNPRAPCGARQSFYFAPFVVSHISIHAPRAGRDYGIRSPWKELLLFQSTRPVRGATAKVYKITLHTFATKGNS